MRYMLDTCSLIFLMNEPDLLSKDIQCLLEDYENNFCISVETIKEIVILYRNKGYGRKRWSKERDIIEDIKKKFFIEILPIKEEQMTAYADLKINTLQDHKDPSDHMIIAHAINNRIPLISCDRKFDFYRNQGLDLISYRKGH